MVYIFAACKKMLLRPFRPTNINESGEKPAHNSFKNTGKQHVEINYQGTEGSESVLTRMSTKHKDIQLPCTDYEKN